MPRLLLFAPCEKVIISQDENNPTLIAVLSEMGGRYTSNVELPPTAMLPLRWSIFALWQQQSGEEQKTFVQTIRLIAPSGTVAGIEPSSLEFRTDKLTQRVVLHLHGIPVAESGIWTLELYINEKGKPQPESPTATYPIKIHVSRESSDPVP